MEGLGAAASVIAVASIAIQLADSARKLYEFWQAIDEAPASIRAMSTDLKLLTTVLTEISLHEQRYGRNGTVTDVLDSCADQIMDMLSMTTKLEGGFGSPSRRVRKWASIKAVFKEERIARFQMLLVQTKTTLILARQTLSEYVKLMEFTETNGQTMAIISKQMTDLQAEYSQVSQAQLTRSNIEEFDKILGLEIGRMASEITSPILRAGFQRSVDVALHRFQSDSMLVKTRTALQIPNLERVGFKPMRTPVYHQNAAGRGSIKTPIRSEEVVTTSTNLFGTVTFRQIAWALRKRHDTLSDEDETESEFSFIFRPSPWLVYVGLSYELRLCLLKSSWGWKHTFQSFQPVSDDALIFEFCRSGHIDGIRSLLSQKKASVWDVNSRGWTPLHVATHEGNLDVVKLLLSEGADPNARTYQHQYCFDLWKHSVDQLDFFQTVLETKKFTEGILEILTLYFAQIADHFAEEDRIVWDECSPECCGHLAHLDPGGDDPPWWDEAMHELILDLKDATIMALSPEFQSFAPEGILGNVLWTYVQDDSRASSCRVAINAVNGFVDARRLPGGYTALFASVIYDAWEQAEVFALQGSNLHAVGIQDSQSPFAETPTSLALYSARKFLEWRKVLRQIDVDMTAFIQQELQQGPLKSRGWTIETLQSIFHLDYTRHGVPDVWPWCQCRLCPDCDDDNSSLCCDADAVITEVSWQNLLADLRGEEAFKGSKDAYLQKEGLGGFVTGTISTESLATSDVSKSYLPAPVDESLVNSGNPSREHGAELQALSYSIRAEFGLSDLHSTLDRLHPVENDDEEQFERFAESDSKDTKLQELGKAEHDTESFHNANGAIPEGTVDLVVDKQIMNSRGEDDNASGSNNSPPHERLCINCWYHMCKPLHQSEPESPNREQDVDSDNEDSPFLLSLGL